MLTMLSLEFKMIGRKSLKFLKSIKSNSVAQSTPGLIEVFTLYTLEVTILKQ